MTSATPTGRRGPDDPRGAVSPVPWLLRRVNQRYRTAIAGHLQAAGLGDLPPPGYWALMALDAGASEANHLVAAMGVTKQRVSKLVDALAAGGFIERRAHDADRRRTALVLTAKGRTAVRAMARAVSATEDAFVDELGATGLADLAALLERLA